MDADSRPVWKQRGQPRCECARLASACVGGEAKKKIWATAFFRLSMTLWREQTLVFAVAGSSEVHTEELQAEDCTLHARVGNRSTTCENQCLLESATVLKMPALLAEPDALKGMFPFAISKALVRRHT